MDSPSKNLEAQLITCVVIGFAITTISGWLSGCQISTGVWFISLAVLVAWPLVVLAACVLLLLIWGIIWIFNPITVDEDGRDEMRRMMDEFTSYLFKYYQPKSFLRLKALLFGAFLGVSLLFARYSVEISP